MKSILFVLPVVFIMACGEGSNPEADAVRNGAVELEMTPYEIEKYDKEQQPEKTGKIVQISGRVVTTGTSQPNEKEFGEHFIFLACEKGPNDPYSPRINCYTDTKPEKLIGKEVTIKGRLNRGVGGILTHSVVMD